MWRLHMPENLNQVDSLDTCVKVYGQCEAFLIYCEK